MLNPDEVNRAKQQITHDRGTPPEIIAVGSAVHEQLKRIAGPALAARGTLRLFGMRVKPDPQLPADVWRLTDPDGALLYDSRQGRIGS